MKPVKKMNVHYSWLTRTDVLCIILVPTCFYLTNKGHYEQMVNFKIFSSCEASPWYQSSPRPGNWKMQLGLPVLNSADTFGRLRISWWILLRLCLNKSVWHKLFLKFEYILCLRWIHLDKIITSVILIHHCYPLKNEQQNMFKCWSNILSSFCLWESH